MASSSPVKLGFFTGLTDTEIAPLLDMSERTAHRTFAQARTWLKRAVIQKS